MGVSGPTKSIPTGYHGDFTLIGCSSGFLEVHFLLTFWQTSHECDANGGHKCEIVFFSPK